MGQWCSASGVWSRRLLLLVRNMIKLWNSLCWLNDPCWVFTKSNSHFSPAPWVQQLKKWKEKTIAFELPIFNTTFKFLGMCVCVYMRVFLFFSAVNVHDIALHRMNDWIASVHADKWAIKPRFLYISVRYQSHYCLFEFWQLIMSLLIQICFLIWINKVYQSTHHSTGTQIHSTKSNSFFVPRLNIFRHTQISSFFIYLAILSLIKPLWEVITLTIKEDVIWSFYCQVVHNDDNAPSPAALYNVLGETSQWFVCVSVCTHTCVHFSFGFVIKEY